MLCYDCQRKPPCGYKVRIKAGVETCDGYLAIFPDADNAESVPKRADKVPQYIGKLCTENNLCGQCRKARASRRSHDESETD